MKYEEAINQIKQLTTEIEQHETNVDELLKKSKKINELLTFCQKKLTQTDEEIKKIFEQNSH
jgi:exodeoxyribonuclease VII small subunit